MRLRGAEVFAAAVADGACQVLGVEVGIVVVRPHVQLKVPLETESLKQTTDLS